jgi:galacturonosyltransferase
VNDGETGLLCRVKDAEDLYQKMRQMANLSRSAREQMGLAARKKIEQEFEKKMVVQKTIHGIFS